MPPATHDANSLRGHAAGGETPDPIDAGLSDRRHLVLVLIGRALKARGVAPSLDELARRIGVRDRSTVKTHVDGLVRDGWLRRVPHKARALELLAAPRPRAWGLRRRDGKTVFERVGP